MIIACMLLSASVIGAPPSVDQTANVRDPLGDPFLDRVLDLCTTKKLVNAPTRTAACELLSSSARHPQRYPILIKMLRDGQGSERNLVQVLGKMAAVDARARDVLAMPADQRMRLQWRPGVVLDQTVVSELLERAEVANRDLVDHYVIALARARDPRALEFLRKVLRQDLGQSSVVSCRFHAAVGLANLGETEGVQWLVDNTDAPGGMVSNAWPLWRCSDRLAPSCSQALRHLTGNYGYSSAEQWRQWWSAERESFEPKNTIELRE